MKLKTWDQPKETYAPKKPCKILILRAESKRQKTYGIKMKNTDTSSVSNNIGTSLHSSLIRREKKRNATCF